MNRRIVLDTNCLLQAISRRNRYYRVWSDFILGRYDLCVTTEIMEEYEEILSSYTSPVVGQMVVETIARANNVLRVDARFRFGLIVADPDDNKFVDCAIVSGAECIVTNDSHFKVLADIPFPHVQVRSLTAFWEDLAVAEEQ